MKQAVVLVGGKGTRLASRLGGRPKPLVDVDGVPLLERQMRALEAYGIEKIVMLASHGREQIAAFCRERSGPEVSIIADDKPLGTAGAVLACLDRLDDRFLIVYGDTLFNIDLSRFLAHHVECQADVSLLLHPNDHPADSDLVEIDGNGWVTAFHPRPRPTGRYYANLVNAAMYVAQKAALARWKDVVTPADFGTDLFPGMLAAGARLRGYVSFEYIKDAGTPTRLDQVSSDMRTGAVERAGRSVRQRAVFLDRDGTLNRAAGYIRTPETLVVMPGVGAAVRSLAKHGYRTVLVTNQPVVARGECTPAELRQIHAKLETELGESGAYLDGIYVCPHHPDRGFPGEIPELKIDCRCRKPGTALVERAVADLNIDVSQSWMVGDSTTDILLAHRAGLRSILVRTGEAGQDGKYRAVADFSAADMMEASQLITTRYPKLCALCEPIVAKLGAGDLVLIGGLARSGKSTLSSVIAIEARAKGLDPVILGLDRWIRPAEDRKVPGVENRYDLASVRQTIEPWLRGGLYMVADAPVYDRRHRRRSATTDRIAVAADAVLILEGVPALLSDLATDRKVHSIYVTTAEHQRRDRVVADLIERGSSKDDALAIHRQREEDETPTIAGSGRRAQYKVSLDDVFSNHVEVRGT